MMRRGVCVCCRRWLADCQCDFDENEEVLAGIDALEAAILDEIRASDDPVATTAALSPQLENLQRERQRLGG